MERALLPTAGARIGAVRPTAFTRPATAPARATAFTADFRPDRELRSRTAIIFGVLNLR